MQIRQIQPKQRTLGNEIILYAVATEKAVRLMNYENKLEFVVHRLARKSEIKAAVQQLFQLKAVVVNTYITRTGEKRAIVTLPKESNAIDIGTQLGIM